MVAKQKLMSSARVYEFPKIRDGFIEQVYFGEALSCSSEGCNTPIANGGKIFVDTEVNPHKGYCYVCGPALRYERKKTAARMETPENDTDR
jgi:hypothetical protein